MTYLIFSRYDNMDAGIFDEHVFGFMRWNIRTCVEHASANGGKGLGDQTTRPESYRAITTELEYKADDTNNPDKAECTQYEGRTGALYARYQVNVVREDGYAAKRKKIDLSRTRQKALLSALP